MTKSFLDLVLARMFAEAEALASELERNPVERTVAFALTSRLIERIEDVQSAIRARNRTTEEAA